MQSVTINGNSITIFQTFKLFSFFQVVRNLNGDEDNERKTFYSTSLICLNIGMDFVPKGCCLISVKCCNVKLPLKRKETYLRSTVSVALQPADRHCKGYMDAPAQENT